MRSEIRKENGRWVFYVDSKPFVMLAGELHNSSASDTDYMEEKVWPRLRGLHLNSLFVPVYWETTEPEEGRYDFALVDRLISQVKRENIRLALLWFGLWKNGISSYVPEWMKTDTETYFRAKDRSGKNMDVISPFCEKAVEKDALAFAELMRHIRQTDGDDGTVILIQVENEVGLLGSDRDCSAAAQREYEREIPPGIGRLYGKSGTWEEAFGEEAPEVFMEYAYAKAIGTIAAAGKKEYPIPMSVNAWIEKFPWRPGTYPSGGPIARFLPVWREFAPDISVLCPDVYTSDFHALCAEYAAEDNPLLIPEHRRDIRNISHMFYAFGEYGALGFSPFGIEDFLMPAEERIGIGNPQVMKILNIDQSAWKCDGTGEFLSEAYHLIESSMGVMQQCAREGKLHGFVRKDEHEKGTVIRLSGCEIRIDYIDQAQDTPKAAGIVMETGENEFAVLGVNARFSVLPPRNSTKTAGILEYSGAGRILNGDERYCMMILDRPEIQYVKWYWY